MSLDDVPIGVKPTNRMPFEQLIEEKLRMQSELDQEQARFGGGGGARSAPRPPPLKKRSSTSSSSLPIQTAPPPPAAQPQPRSISPNPAEDFTSTVDQEASRRCSIQPKKFLKKGEGLLRYDPAAAKKRVQMSQSKRKSSLGGAPSSSSKSSGASDQATTKPCIVNRVVSSAQNRQGNKPTNGAISRPVANKPATVSNPVAKGKQPSQQPIINETKSNESRPLDVLASRSQSSISSESPNEEDVTQKELDDENGESELIEEEEIEYKPIRTMGKRSISFAGFGHQQMENNRKLTFEPNEFNFQEEEELREFEKLERYTEEHPSFRSSISYVENILQFRCSQQEQQPDLTINNNSNHSANSSHNSSQLTLVEQLVQLLKKNPEFRSFDTEAVRSEIMNRLLEEQTSTAAAAAPPPQSSPSSSSTASASSTASPDAADYSFTHSNGVVRKVKRITSEDKHASEGDTARDDDTEYAGYQSENYQDPEDEDEDAYHHHEEPTLQLFGSLPELDPEKEVSVYEIFLRSTEPKNSSKQIKFDDTSPWTDELATRKDEFREEATAVAAAAAAASNEAATLFERAKRAQLSSNDEAKSVNASANLLREKIATLDVEIDKFRKQNAELSERTRKLEADRRMLETERRVFDKEKREETARLKEIHDDEMRKLRVEKRTFEQYKQALKERPSRKERDEIDKLTQKCHELTEEMKLRESRWAANTARLKERIETLEREKLELKESLKLAEKLRLESLVKVTTNSDQLKSSLKNRVAVNKQQQQPPLRVFDEDAGHQDESTDLEANCPESAYFQSKVVSPAPREEHETTSGLSMKRTISEKSLPISTPAATSSTSSSSSSSSSISSGLATRRQQSAPYLLAASNSSLESLKSASASSTQSTQFSPVLSQKPTTSKSVTWSLERNSVEIIDYENNSVVAATAVATNEPPSPPPVEFAVSSIKGVERRLRVLKTRQLGEGVDKLLEDGTLLTIFSNGTIKEISPDKKLIVVKFFNGDQKMVDHELDKESYFYHETGITQVFYGTGLQILEFPNGQVEKIHLDQKREIVFPDKSVRIIFPDGSEETHMTNGVIVNMKSNGEKVITHPNQMREVHTSELKKREYPDGTVKIVYTKSGMVETRYSNGRVRVKDAAGNLISDTQPAAAR